jgi:hypothetical protein
MIDDSGKAGNDLEAGGLADSLRNAQNIHGEGIYVRRGFQRNTDCLLSYSYKQII